MLSHDLMKRKFSHAYMLVGPAGPARDDAAKELAAGLLCGSPVPPCRSCRDCRKVLAGIHPDVNWVERSRDDKGRVRRELLVDQIRSVTADAVVAPNEAARKVYIIHEADHMNEAAQNALLKSLEEPPGHACFILCTESVEALLATIRSRCVRLDGERLSGDDDGAPMRDFARQFEHLAAGGEAAPLMEFCMMRSKLEQNEAERFLGQVQDDLCEILCRRLENPGLTRERIWKMTALMDRAEEGLRYNVGLRQIFGVLAAEILR